jgi:hypothetical protein
MKISEALLFPFGMSLCISVYAHEIKSDVQISELPSSLEVLSKVADKYRNLTSYQDEGIALTKFERTMAEHTTERHFTTAYSRSGQFRFEFSESGSVGGQTRYVVWKKGEDVKSWWTIEPVVKRHESLGSAISGATGVSGGTAYTIPSILMKEAAWKGSTWISPAKTYRINDGAERDIACFRTQRLTSTEAKVYRGIESPATKGKVTYWVSKDQFLLLRVDRETDFGSFLTKETVQYFPTINSPIQDAAFEFGH